MIHKGEKNNLFELLENEFTFDLLCSMPIYYTDMQISAWYTSEIFGDNSRKKQKNFVLVCNHEHNYQQMSSMLMYNLSLSFGSIWHCAPAIRSIATLNLLILCSSTFEMISRRPLCLWGAIKQDLRWTFYHNLPTTVTTAEREGLYKRKLKKGPGVKS